MKCNPSPAAAKRERAALMRSIARDLKAKDRARLLELRGRIREAKRARSTAIARARAACRRRRELPTVRQAAAMLRQARQEARATCSAELEGARGLKDAIARARAEHAAEQKYQREMRRIERGQRQAREQAKRPGLARARRSESDDEVRGNIPPELVYLWDRVKRGIRATDRMTRTEAFLQYAHDHPDEEIAALEDKTDAMIREYERRANPRGRAKRNPRKGKPSTGAQRELFMPASGQLEIVPSHQQTQAVKAAKESAAARTVPLFKNPAREPRYRALGVDPRGRIRWVVAGDELAAVKRRADERGDACAVEVYERDAKKKRAPFDIIAARRDELGRWSNPGRRPPSVAKGCARRSPSRQAAKRPVARNPSRPPAAWWRRCIERIEKRDPQARVRSPAAVCGASWWRLPELQRAAIVARLERGKGRRDRRQAYALARAEERHRRKKNPKEDDAGARREYVRTHWGERGSGRVRKARAARPDHGTATELGKLVAVVYRTKKKGDRRRTDYEHEFDGPLPTLAYNDGGLIVAGGGYRILSGGITG